jgi:YYY domain-containing protein
VLPNTRWAIILIVVFFAVCSCVLFWRRRSEIKEYLSRNRSVIIATEAIFLSAFILYAVIRSYNPEIVNTEKPMDFAFLNAIMRTDYFPPHDPWLSGFSLNNYYFGHMIVATLSKFTGVSTAVSFNLSLALIFALAAAGAFSIVYNLVKMCHKGIKTAIGFGVIAAVFLLILGNLEGALETGYAHGMGSEGFWNWVGINGLQTPYHSGHWYPSEFWWWWHASRVIAPVGGIDTITEFPYFSFLLGDLHAHLLSLPFVLLSLTVILNLFATEEPLGLGWLRKNIAPFILMVICIGALGAIHTWDLLIYLFIFVAAVWIQTRVRHSTERWWKGWGLIGGIAIVGSILFYLPFYLNMSSPVNGISLWKGPDARILHQIILWGLFLFIGVSFLVAQSRGILKSSLWRVGAITAGALLFLWIAWAVAVAASGGGANIGLRFAYSIPPIILLTAVVVIAFNKIKEDKVNPSVIFVLLLIFTGLLLVYGCGLFYVNDGWFGRMNTVFRFYYQAWILFALASAFGLYYIWSHWKVARIRGNIVKSCWWFVFTLLLVGSLLYPIAATCSRTNAFSSNPTLDGLAYLKESNPSEYEAISWIDDNIDGAPVILEAVGDVYSTYGRVSVFTGLPTVLGWEQHERHWRGWTESGSDIVTQARRDDVNFIYQSDDLDQVKAIISKYNITFVYVGDLERASYGEDVAMKFADFTDVIFENEGVIIYKVME